MSTLAKAERKEMEESKDMFFSQASLFSRKSRKPSACYIKTWNTQDIYVIKTLTDVIG